MVLYGITLVPLAEELRSADPGLLSLFYADDAAFNVLARLSAQLLKLLMKRGPDWGYFPEPAKSLFISDTPGQEDRTGQQKEINRVEEGVGVYEGRSRSRRISGRTEGRGIGEDGGSW